MKEATDDYAIVLFEDGIGVIRTDWALYKDDLIFATYFPPNVTSLQLTKLLKAKTSDFNKLEWCDENKEPYVIKQVYDFASTLEAAEKKVDIYIDLSDVETDEGKNMERLKRSRFSRCLKRKSDEEDFDEVKNHPKRKALKIITNTLIKPASNKTIRPFTKESYSTENGINSALLESIATVSMPNTEINSNKKVKPAASATPIEQNENLLGAASNSPVFDLGVPSASKTNEEVSGAASNSSVFDLGDPSASNEEVSGNTTNTVSTNSNDTDKSKKAKKKSSAKNSSKLLLQKMNKMEVMVKSVCDCKGGQNSGKPSFDNKDEELNLFPAKNKQELLAIEKKLRSKRFFLKVSEAAALLGMTYNVFVTVGRMLNELLTYKTGQLYSYVGRSDKKPAFKDLKLKHVISKAMSIIRPTTTKEEIKAAISRWLHNCKGNDARLQKRLEKRRKDEEEETLDLEDSDNTESEAESGGNSDAESESE